MTLTPKDESIELLKQIGFTKTQAKLYLTLITAGKTDAKNLAKLSNVPRQAVYRSLNELQEKGMVEKIISLPQEYKAIPLKEALRILIKSKAEEYDQVLEKAKTCLIRFEEQKAQESLDKSYYISILEGKETVINKIKYLTENTQSTLCVCQTPQRWLQVNLQIFKTVKEALKRGVKYRVIIEESSEPFVFEKTLKPILSNPNYKVRLANHKLKINAAIYDDKFGCFSFYPGKSVSGTPVIVTNHQSLLVGFLDHFERLWQDSKELNLKEALK
jgi:sugar-specific transcriptional regulator TrmB